MKKLSDKALDALNDILENYGEDVVEELVGKIEVDTKTIQQYHLDLLKLMYFSEDGEYIICNNYKRPFGNSDINNDVRETIGLPVSDTQIDEILGSITKITKMLFHDPSQCLNNLLGEVLK